MICHRWQDGSGGSDESEGESNEGGGAEGEAGPPGTDAAAADAAAADAAAGVPKKRKRQPRFEGYEADFIDDSEVMKFKSEPAGRAKYDGFAIVQVR